MKISIYVVSIISIISLVSASYNDCSIYGNCEPVKSYDLQYGSFYNISSNSSNLWDALDTPSDISLNDLGSFQFTSNSFNGSGNITTTGKIMMGLTKTSSNTSIAILGESTTSIPLVNITNTANSNLLTLTSQDGILSTYIMFNVAGDNESDRAFGTSITGDSFGRFLFDVSGVMTWGNGVSTRDTNLYRNSSNLLATDDSLQAKNLSLMNNDASAPMIKMRRANGNVDDDALIGVSYVTGVADDFMWIGNATTRKYLNIMLNSGKVGIGLNSYTPTHILNVIGDANITSNTTFGELIRLEIRGLPLCGTATNGSIGRNATGVYGCNTLGAWIKIF